MLFYLQKDEGNPKKTSEMLQNSGSQKNFVFFNFIYLYLTNNLTKLQFVKKKRETSFSQYKNCEAN